MSANLHHFDGVHHRFTVRQHNGGFVRFIYPVAHLVYSQHRTNTLQFTGCPVGHVLFLLSIRKLNWDELLLPLGIENPPCGKI